MSYHSQHGQDQFIHERFFQNHRSGTFIEFGALDGVIDSNTLFFERELGWNGILIEPNPVAFARLVKNRPNAIKENVALSDCHGRMPFVQIIGGFLGWSGIAADIEPQHRERIQGHLPQESVHEIEVEVRDLAWLLDRHPLDQVDFMSIDTEGTEAKIMRAFPWERVRVSVFCIENNFDNYAIDDLMNDRGYAKVARLGTDDIFCLHELAQA
ncbi:FkbM family methyltransferase [Thiocapsa marina]|uniref:Methyltransferase FkbM family n=1 Tax=Thiocapsa marina 5811 TaxID=768671 RepID=F9U9C2_9GAMM|nr:FkbM family methyltransferase [Thiocapsa marina]EGV19380.1 methyltransferase FkbM family [Thiocapsa marina 5811]